MNSDEKRLDNDTNHLQQCHERWHKNLHRDMTSPTYKDEWYAQQCLHCRFYIPLTGTFADDYGACTNPASPCDATVRFEHDGCDHFSPALD